MVPVVALVNDEVVRTRGVVSWLTISSVAFLGRTNTTMTPATISTATTAIDRHDEQLPALLRLRWIVLRILLILLVLWILLVWLVLIPCLGRILLWILLGWGLPLLGRLLTLRVVAIRIVLAIAQETTLHMEFARVNI